MYVILGCGSTGYLAASRLQEMKKSAVVVEKSHARCESLKGHFKSVVEGDMCSKDVLKKVKVETASAVLILTTDSELNKKAARAVRELAPHVPVIVRGSGTKNEFKAEEADIVLYPTSLVAEYAIKKLEDLEFKRKLKSLLGVISEAEREVAIVTQNNPDPDAISSALSLKRIAELQGKKAEIIYGGEIGHEENRALVNLLGIELTHISKVKDLRNYSKIALVESSIPGVNNPLPKDVTPDIVIDHHQVNLKELKSRYVDVRSNVGATATILTEYLCSINDGLDKTLATALLYGIRTDTQDFTRGATADDLKAAALLYPKADNELLKKIEAPLMSSETLDVLGEAIKNRKIRGSYLLSNVGFIRDRDTLPQAADYLLNLEGVSTVVVYGIGKDVVHVSGRNRDIRINLGEVMNRAFGEIGQAGGHSHAAAAKIPLGLFGNVKDKDSLLRLAEEAIGDRFLRTVGMAEKKE